MMAPASPKGYPMVAISVARRSRTKGGLVTLGIITGLVIAMGITLFGTGAANHAVASFDASSWLWSTGKGELARVNGVTGRADTRTKITDAQGHTMQVTQSDRYVILRDLTTGKVSVLDLSSLTLGTTTQTTPGLGVTVALHDNTAFIIDAPQGLVRQLDPATLAPIGQPLSFPSGITGGTFDESGRLWLLVPSEGTVVAIKPAAVASAKAGGSGGQGGGTTTDPTIARNAVVADPSHDLTLSILDTGVAVLDKTAGVMTTVRGDKTHKVDLKLSGPGEMPDRTVGPDVPVTVVDDSHVYVVNGDRVHDFTAPGTSPRIQPCTAWSGRLYCPDDATGAVYVLDQQGKLTETISVPDAGRGLVLDVREDHLFINSPDTSNAVVVDNHHNAKSVNKYANNVLGGDLPPAPPPPPVVKPVVGPPSAPAGVTATAGNATAHVAWQAAAPNGAAITKYVVEGDGQSHVVGANQRTFDVTGLTNGQTYKFTVYAVNSKGNGPKRAANPVVPTSDVPDPPVSVAAAANPDGTVTITWPAANGLGRKIAHYTVTAVSTGEPKTFDATTPTFTTKAGDLTYGTQYAFKVASINDIGASSTQSPLSASVVPFAAPGAPTGLKVAAVTTKRGTISATWQMPAANGAAITGYQVTVNGGQKQTVTGTSVEVPGFPDNAKVSLSVSAVNKAGAGAPATGSGTTLTMPTLTLQPSTGNQFNAITVNFTATDGGGTPPTCTLQVTGAGTASNRCTGALTVAGLWPGNTYNYTLTVTNAAGMAASGTGSLGTPAYHGTVICGDNSYCGHGAPNGGIWVYKTPSQGGQSVGDVFHPDSYQAVCHVNGGQVNATPWGGKDSSVWIRIVFPGSGQNYIPYAWFKLDSGDNYNVVPGC
jgi:hypothetical protein